MSARLKSLTASVLVLSGLVWLRSGLASAPIAVVAAPLERTPVFATATEQAAATATQAAVITQAAATAISQQTLTPASLTALPSTQSSPTCMPLVPSETPIVRTVPPLTGASLQLNAPSAPDSASTIVQWQDELGGWHAVEGWRGELGAEGQITWWVLKANFAQGPFRWVVYTEPGGEVWGVSENFFLPSASGEALTINLLKP